MNKNTIYGLLGLAFCGLFVICIGMYSFRTVDAGNSSPPQQTIYTEVGQTILVRNGYKYIYCGDSAGYNYCFVIAVIYDNHFVCNLYLDSSRNYVWFEDIEYQISSVTCNYIQLNLIRSG